MRGLGVAWIAEPSRKYERLVRDPDASPEVSSGETDETSSTTQFEDGLALQRTFARNVV